MWINNDMIKIKKKITVKLYFFGYFDQIYIGCNISSFSYFSEVWSVSADYDHAGHMLSFEFWSYGFISLVSNLHQIAYCLNTQYFTLFGL